MGNSPPNLGGEFELRLCRAMPLYNNCVTSCFFEKVFGTLTRRFAAPSPRGRGTFCRRVLLPLGGGGPGEARARKGEALIKGRMRALVAASPHHVFVFFISSQY